MSPNRNSPMGLASSYAGNTQFMKSFSDREDENAVGAIETESSNHSSRSNLSDTPQPPSPPHQELNLSAGLDNPILIQKVAKHLPQEDSLSQEGGDIVRDLYKIGHESRNTPELRRARSFSSEDLGRLSRRSSTSASSINVPGGFRREFLIQQSTKFNAESVRTQTPNFLTRNFIEFLSVYGNFAGEELEDEENVANHYKYLLPSEEMPLIEENFNPKGTATDKKAYFLLLKAFIGTGVLFLPKAFSNGGLVFSIVTLLFFAALSYWCYLILVYAKTAVKVSSFAELGLKLYGNWLQRLILSSIVISQMGFVAAYIVFTSENLRAFIVNLSGYNTEDLPIFWFIMGQVLVITPLALIRDITKLSLLAVLANFFILTGLVTVLYFIFYEWLLTNNGHFGNNIEYFFNESEFSLFIGTAIFAFEGIGLIIPIQESMIYPNNFPKVLGQVILTISIAFIVIGSLGYLTFGDNIHTVILLNLPQDSVLVIMTQLLYSFAILLSTPLQLFPAIRLIESKLFFMSGKQSITVKWLKNCFRTLFVLLIAYIALIGGRNLDKFVSFVGCFACIPLVYMYPPILHLKSCCNIHDGLLTQEKSSRYWLGVLDYVLVLIGGVAMVYTTYQILAL